MKQLLFPLFASLLMIYSSQGQQATPIPHDLAASDLTEADNTKRNSSEQNKNTDTAEKQSNSKDDLGVAIADGPKTTFSSFSYRILRF
jgi:hypothetical protein